MSIRESNYSRVFASGLTNAERLKSSSMRTILSQFNNSNPSYFSVHRNNDDWIDAIITDNISSAKSEKLDNTKTMIAHPDVILKVGDIINYDSKHWICYEVERFNNLYYKGYMRLANNNLKLMYGTPESLISVPCITTSRTQNIDANRFTTLEDGTIKVLTRSNDITKSIGLDMRFIFGKLNVFKVIAINDFDEDGLITFLMKSEQKNKEDNFETGIAYNAPLFPTNPDSYW